MTEQTHIIPIGTTQEWHGVIITMTEDGWRAEVKHNMHRRCRGWDYCKPWIYLITIDTQHHDVPPVPVMSSGSVPLSGSESQSSNPAPQPVPLSGSRPRAQSP